MKLNPEKIEELTTALARLVPESLSEAGEDVRANLRAVAQAWFDRLDLVTREEFDAQKAVLARTREKLDELTRKLEAETEDP